MTSTSKISPAVVQYEDLYQKILATGSQVICDPPPEGTDEDYIILVSPEELVTLENRLRQDNWASGGSLPNGSPELHTAHDFNEDGTINQTHLFHSWKRRENYQVTPTEHPVYGSYNVKAFSGPLINLLVACNEQYFEDFTRATFLCRALNLTDKHDRVTVFEALTRDIWPTHKKTAGYSTTPGSVNFTTGAIVPGESLWEVSWSHDGSGPINPGIPIGG